MAVWLSILACHHPPPQPAAEASEVRIPTPFELLEDAPARCREGLDVGDPPALAAALHANYERCGPGHALLAAEALVHYQAGDTLGALALALRELQEPGPSQVAMDMALGLLGSAPPAVRAQGVALGRDAEHPLYVPTIAAEYQWVQVAGCAEGPATEVSQALILTDDLRLDLLSFACGADRGAVYFDFGADPATQALEQALQP